jgi:UDP-N-acetylmuramate--alanine ligase
MRGDGGMRHKVKHVHFVGIGGAGMSGIAEVMFNLGFKVTGSDLNDNAVIEHLRSLGVHVEIGHAREHIAGADVIVTSTAVKADNPEVTAARNRRIPVVPRAMMLAELMRLKQGIAVAGTHGKTTTTSLVASVLAEAGMDPTFVIGGRLEAAGSHAKLGTGEFIVVEADESDASFLYLQPVVAVVTNIDSDHMDTYAHDFGRLRQAFLEFVEHLPFYGTAVLCIDDENVRSLLPIITKTVTTYGLNESAHFRAVDIVYSGSKMRFRVTRRTQADESVLPDLVITLNIPGEHNVRNALAAIAVATEVGAPDEAIVRALAGFRGVGRRFQNYGEIALEKGGSFTLIDDYGHHPAEIAPTIAAVRGAFPGQRVLLVFQPHRYTRTRDCFEDFVRVLSTVDALLLTEVYAAGESPIVAADGRALARAVRVAGKVEPVFVEKVSELPAAIREIACPGDVVVTMGAGSIGSVPGLLAGAGLVKH